MIKAVIFDLFETLITETTNNKITSAKIAGLLEVPINEYRVLVSRLRDQRYRGELPDFRDVLVYVMQSLGKPCNNDLINNIAADREQCKAQCFENISKEIIFMLTELKKRNLKLALLSNASYEEISAFNNCALQPYFDVVVFSCHTGYVKPEPEIYHEATNSMGVDTRECLYIGDGGSDELTGAKNVGMQVLCSTWFTSKLGFAPPEGFPVVQSTNELISIVDSNISRRAATLSHHIL